jgi:hypothetical protein
VIVFMDDHPAKAPGQVRPDGLRLVPTQRLLRSALRL